MPSCTIRAKSTRSKKISTSLLNRVDSLRFLSIPTISRGKFRFDGPLCPTLLFPRKFYRFETTARNALKSIYIISSNTKRYQNGSIRTNIVACNKIRTFIYSAKNWFRHVTFQTRDDRHSPKERFVGNDARSKLSKCG